MINLRGRGLIFAVLFLAVVSIVADRFMPGSHELVAWQSIAAGQAQARAHNKPIIYDFTAAWCPPCQMLKKTVFADPSIADRINSQFVPIQVLDRRREEGKNPREVEELQMRYRIDGFPTVIATAPDGEPYAAFDGLKSKEYVASFLDEAIRKHAASGASGTGNPR